MQNARCLAVYKRESETGDINAFRGAEWLYTIRIKQCSRAEKRPTHSQHQVSQWNKIPFWSPTICAREEWTSGQIRARWRYQCNNSLTTFKSVLPRVPCGRRHPVNNHNVLGVRPVLHPHHAPTATNKVTWGRLVDMQAIIDDGPTVTFLENNALCLKIGGC